MEIAHDAGVEIARGEEHPVPFGKELFQIGPDDNDGGERREQGAKGHIGPHQAIRQIAQSFFH